LTGFLGAHPLPAAAALLVLLAGAGLGGALLKPGAAGDVPIGQADPLLAAVEAQAARAQGMAGYWNSPYGFENVDARPRADGGLELSFDVVRHVSMETAADSPVAREVLFHAILDRGNMGGRLRAMDLSPAALDPQLEEALVFALHNDPDTAIRVKALSVLQQYPDSPAVRNAMLTVLRDDPSVELRLLALEALAARQVPGDAVRQAILAKPQDDDDAVLEYAEEIARF
jgi:hypothetical protein